MTFIATAEPGDDEMAQRIELHRAQRPSGWTTIEEPLDLRGALARSGDDAAVVIECVSLWVANVVNGRNAGVDVEEEARAAAALAGTRRSLTVAVSNEVGLGIIPETPLGRRYRDVLGRVNATWAAAAERAALVVAGRVLPLDRPETIL